MAQETSNEERAAEKSFNESPKTINKATTVMVIGGIILLIIATVMLLSFCRNDTNTGNSTTPAATNRASP